MRETQRLQGEPATQEEELEQDGGDPAWVNFCAVGVVSNVMESALFDHNDVFDVERDSDSEADEDLSYMQQKLFLQPSLERSFSDESKETSSEIGDDKVQEESLSGFDTPSGIDDEYEEVLSLASDDAFDEECHGERAMLYVQAAMRVAKGATDYALQDEYGLEPASNLNHWLNNSVAAEPPKETPAASSPAEQNGLEAHFDETEDDRSTIAPNDEVQEAFHELATEDVAFDCVCGLLDEGISGVGLASEQSKAERSMRQCMVAPDVSETVPELPMWGAAQQAPQAPASVPEAFRLVQFPGDAPEAQLGGPSDADWLAILADLQREAASQPASQETRPAPAAQQERPAASPKTVERPSAAPVKPTSPKTAERPATLPVKPTTPKTAERPSVAPVKPAAPKTAERPQSRAGKPSAARPTDAQPQPPAIDVAPAAPVRPSSQAVKAQHKTAPSPTAETASNLFASMAKSTAANSAATRLPAARAEMAPTSPAQAQQQQQAGSTMAACRSRRRIIGGVVRATAEERELATSASNLKRSMGGGSDVLIQKHPASQKASATMFRMDRSDSSSAADFTTFSAARESSLTKGYDALGVEFHRLDEDDWRRASSRQASRTPLQQPITAPRLRGPLGAASALVLDLGEGASNSTWGRGEQSQVQGRPPTGTLDSLGRSPSNSGLRVTKAMPQGAQTSSGSVAWSMRMARSAAKRTGLGEAY